MRIVDRASFPRDKLCGDTLNPGCLAMLAGIDAAIANRVRTSGLTTTGMTVTGPGAAVVSASYPGGVTGTSLMRRELDAWLLEAAMRAGARFDAQVSASGPLLEGTRVVGIVAGGAKRQALRARVVIAADGRASRLGSALGLTRFSRAPRRWAFGAYYQGVDGVTAHGEMHIRANGYTGIAALPGNLANVCAVRERSHLREGLSPEQVIRSAIDGDPALMVRFSGARRVSPVVVLGPLGVESEGAGCPGLLLAGDAAGFIDPMTGDGLRFAIRGGELAAMAAHAELETGTAAHHQLYAWRRREFAAKCRLNRVLRALVGSRRALSCAALASRAWHAPVEYLVGVAGDVALARGTA